MVDEAVHLEADLISRFLEHFRDLYRILGRNNVAFLGGSEAALVGLGEGPVTLRHLLVKVVGLSIVAPEEGKSHLMVLLRVRPLHCWLQLAFLIIDHLLEPLGLGDGLIGDVFQGLLPHGVLCVCDLF